MRRIQWKSIKFYSLFLLSLVAIMISESSCNQEETMERPSATFILKGTVVSAIDQQPLKNILVTMLVDTIRIDTATTDQDGRYELIDSLGIPAEVAYYINFRDVDNELKSSNEVIDSTMLYSFINLTFTNGDGHWYSGEVSKELNVSLKPRIKVVSNSSN